MMKKLVIGILMIGFASLSNAQNVNSTLKVSSLNSVDVFDTNLDYLSKTKVYNMPGQVMELEKKASRFTVKKSILFDPTIIEQEIVFTKPYAEIVATYDNTGRILRSKERFEQITFPFHIRNAIFNQYPDYKIHKNVYMVSYDHKEGVNQEYRAQLRKNNKKINIKLDANGNLLDQNKINAKGSL